MQTTFDNMLKQLKENDPNLTLIDYTGGHLGMFEDSVLLLATALAMNTNVINLDLSGNRIGDLGTQQLAKAMETNTAITTLELEGNEITPIGAQYLASALEINKTLTTLRLWRNKIGDTGTKDLAKALEKNPSLSSLLLAGNEISDVGVKYLAKTLKKNKSIKMLNLHSNQIGDEGAKALAKALKKNSSLNILILNNGWGKKIKIGDSGAKEIANALEINKSLTILDLGSNSIESEGAKYIASALEKNNSITTLKLGGNNVGNMGAKDIADTLKKNTKLKVLDLSYCGIDVEGVKVLAESLENNTSLIELNLMGNTIGNTGAIHLARALEMNTTLITLDLHFTGNLSQERIEKVGATIIAEALIKNIGLTTLNMENNAIGDTGAENIANALEKNTTLTSINLSSNRIYNKGIKQISNALENNTTLTYLNLYGNGISDDGAIDLARALEKNCSLTTINLQYNPNMSNVGYKALANALKNNYTLLKLDRWFEEAKISLYLERNNNIANCLKPFNEAIKNDSILNDGEIIESCLKKLKKILPNLESLPEESYPSEVYRMLSAWGHALGHSSTGTEESQIVALQILSQPFKNQHFQLIAEKTLGLLLAGDFSNTLTKHQLEKEGWLLSLYAFRNHLQSPEINTFAQSSLFKLINGKGSDYSFHDRQLFENDTVILTEIQFLNLLKNALASLEKDKSESYEILLLEALLQSKVCHTFGLSTACQSKSFLNAFKSQYPKTKSFTTIDHCLVTAGNGDDSFLVDIRQEPKHTISESDVAEYAFELIHTKTNLIADVIEDLKQTFEKAFPEETRELTETIVEAQSEISVKSKKKAKTLPSTNDLYLIDINKDKSLKVKDKRDFLKLTKELSETQLTIYLKSLDADFLKLIIKDTFDFAEVIDSLNETQQSIIIPFLDKKLMILSMSIPLPERDFTINMRQLKFIISFFHETQKSAFIKVFLEALDIDFIKSCDDLYWVLSCLTTTQKETCIDLLGYDFLKTFISNEMDFKYMLSDMPISRHISFINEWKTKDFNKIDASYRTTLQELVTEIKNEKLEYATYDAIEFNKYDKQALLIQKIKEIKFSVLELNGLYNDVKNTWKNKWDLNAHQNPSRDGFFGIKNTASWQNTVKQLRQIALKTLFEEINAEDSHEKQLELLEHARTLPVFCEHRNNSIITGAWGRTDTIRQIEDKIEEIEGRIQNRRS